MNQATTSTIHKTPGGNPDTGAVEAVPTLTQVYEAIRQLHEAGEVNGLGRGKGHHHTTWPCVNERPYGVASSAWSSVTRLSKYSSTAASRWWTLAHWEASKA